MTGPVRTCIGCRERTGKFELVRLVRSAGTVVEDPRQTRSGRGAYLHRRAECLDLAVRRRAFGRALRAGGGDLDLAAVRSTLSQAGDWA